MKNNQRGGALMAVLITLGFIAALVGMAVVSYISAYNYGNDMENRLKAQQDNNRNILAQYGQKVMEIAQVPEMYKNDLKEVTSAAIGGRYGKDGAKAVFLAIKEQNPTISENMYTKIQQVMEAGRNDFQEGQTRLLDIRRQYETELGTFWRGMWLKFAGKPKVNLSDFDIVSTDRADTAFKNKKEDGPIQLRK